MPAALPVGEPAPADGRLPPDAVAGAATTDFGAYVHIPFCRTRCGYCDFNTYTAEQLGPDVGQGSYADTVLAEVRLAAGLLRGRVPPLRTVFFGGGTPTLLPAGHLALILDELRDSFGLAADVEITTEANPETVAPGYLASLRAAGFTRISLGMQSAVPRVLAVLDRTHTPGRAAAAVAEARGAGFAHVNLDLIYGAPHESDADWQASLDAAIAAEPDHISAYALVVEEGTALARRVASGDLPAVDDDVLADRYVLADETLSAAGYGWYEVSNWTTSPAGRCRHNELYWRDANWWGFGPGAHSHVGGVRWWNVKHPARYASMLDSGLSPAAGRERLSARQRHTEKVMLGVRMREGLAFAELSPAAVGRAPQLATWGLVEARGLADERIVLTQRGRLLADAVIRELLE